MRPMKLGIVGKGGAGKTTVAGLLARTFADRGERVVAIDTDSNPNLGLSLGLSAAETDAVIPLPRNLMVGSPEAGSTEDLMARYGRATTAGPTLLSAMKVTEAGAGCTCSGHAAVRNLLAESLVDVDVTLVDMEAGLEHLSRSGGTLAYADVLVVVCDPTRKAVMTAERTATLAAELGIPRVLVLGNKARGSEDEAFFATEVEAAGLTLIGVLPYVSEVSEADRSGATAVPSIPPAVQETLDDVIGAIDAVARPQTV